MDFQFNEGDLQSYKLHNCKIKLIITLYIQLVVYFVDFNIWQNYSLVLNDKPFRQFESGLYLKSIILIKTNYFR